MKAFSYAEGQATGLHRYFVLKMTVFRYFKLSLRQVLNIGPPLINEYPYSWN